MEQDNKFTPITEPAKESKPATQNDQNKVDVDETNREKFDKGERDKKG